MHFAFSWSRDLHSPSCEVGLAPGICLQGNDIAHQLPAEVLHKTLEFLPSGSSIRAISLTSRAFYELVLGVESMGDVTADNVDTVTYHRVRCCCAAIQQPLRCCQDSSTCTPDDEFSTCVEESLRNYIMTRHFTLMISCSSFADRLKRDQHDLEFSLRQEYESLSKLLCAELSNIRALNHTVTRIIDTNLRAIQEGISASTMPHHSSRQFAVAKCIVLIFSRMEDVDDESEDVCDEEVAATGDGDVWVKTTAEKTKYFKDNQEVWESYGQLCRVKESDAVEKCRHWSSASLHTAVRNTTRAGDVQRLVRSTAAGKRKDRVELSLLQRLMLLQVNVHTMPLKLVTTLRRIVEEDPLTMHNFQVEELLGDLTPDPSSSSSATAGTMAGAITQTPEGVPKFLALWTVLVLKKAELAHTLQFQRMQEIGTELESFTAKIKKLEGFAKTLMHLAAPTFSVRTTANHSMLLVPVVQRDAILQEEQRYRQRIAEQFLNEFAVGIPATTATNTQ